MPKKIPTDDKPVKKTVKRAPRTPRAKKIETPANDYSKREKLYALDIGTRSVIGIVAVKEDDGTLTIIATHRQEHKTRAMMDGQIHDVPKVAAIIKDVTRALEKQVGKLQSAGRRARIIHRDGKIVV